MYISILLEIIDYIILYLRIFLSFNHCKARKSVSTASLTLSSSIVPVPGSYNGTSLEVVFIILPPILKFSEDIEISSSNKLLKKFSCISIIG